MGIAKAPLWNQSYQRGALTVSMATGGTGADDLCEAKSGVIFRHEYAKFKIVILTRSRILLCESLHPPCECFRSDNISGSITL